MRVYQDISEFTTKNSILTVGVFDGVHEGHISVVKRIKEIAKENNNDSVVFTFWPHPRMVFQPDDHNLKILNSINEKILLFKKTGIDHLIIYPFTLDFSKLSSCEFITEILVKKLRISKLVVGYNHHFGHNREGTYKDIVKYAEENKFSIERLEPYYIKDVDISSTIIRNSLLNGDLQKANKYLGYNYFLSGKVVKGSKVGRLLGFPTANIEPDNKFKLIPKDGVYAVTIEYDKKIFKGMLNIGLRPTVNNKTKIKSIEVHIFNFDKLIYNKTITVHFIDRIRDEIKFDNIEELKNQLQADKRKILKVFVK